MVYLVKLYEFWPVFKQIMVDSTGRRLRSCGVVVSAEQIHAMRVTKYYKAMLIFGVIIVDGIFYHRVCFMKNFPTNLIVQSKIFYRLQ